jgi:hypothetical protein
MAAAARMFLGLCESGKYTPVPGQRIREGLISRFRKPMSFTRTRTLSSSSSVAQEHHVRVRALAQHRELRLVG